MPTLARARNDHRQYDDLASDWWDPAGPLAMLHWLARTRAAAVPAGNGTLLDLACGGGLMAPHLEGKGYAHVGIDINESALRASTPAIVDVVQGDVTALPFADGSIDVLCAGEIFEHVTDLEQVVAEGCRVLRPGGFVIIDTLADTKLARLLAVTIGERVHGGAPAGLHDPDLFVNRDRLVRSFREGGVQLQLRGLRPSMKDLVRWKTGEATEVRMVPTRSTSVLFQGWGHKAR